jgi:hypothetical protein
MDLLTRFGYAVRLTCVAGAIIGLLISIGSADVIALLPISAFDVLGSPFYLLILYIASFIASPWVSDYFPIKRNEP